MAQYSIDDIIVVEGKNDTNTLKSWFKCDTIETNGSALSDETIETIRHAVAKRGVIVFTDPDYPGHRIRQILDREVPGCKHAFLPKEEAVDVRKKKVGIEHASQEALLTALTAAKPSKPDGEEVTYKESISKHDLLKAGLIAGPDAKRRRERLGQKLSIGYTNGKQLYNRLNQFKVTKTDFEEALVKVEKEIDQS